MNEEHTTIPHDPLSDVPPSHPLSASDAEAAGTDPSLVDAPASCEESETAEAALEATDPSPALFADPVSAADPDPGAAVPQGEENGLDDLQAELTRLRARLAAQEEDRRMSAECREFCELYPDVSLSSLPDRVWEDVSRGVPVAAAYALAQRRRARTEEQAAESNRANRLRSAGALTPAENDYFTPDEVRAMTPDEVRANYRTIKRSMQSWH